MVALDLVDVSITREKELENRLESAAFEAWRLSISRVSFRTGLFLPEVDLLAGVEPLSWIVGLLVI